MMGAFTGGNAFGQQRQQNLDGGAPGELFVGGVEEPAVMRITTGSGPRRSAGEVG
jgi:hypothetical protein